MSTLRLLVWVGAGLSLSVFSEGVVGTLEGNMSSRKVCHRMFGGLLMMLKMANLTMGARLRVKGAWGC